MSVLLEWLTLIAAGVVAFAASVLAILVGLALFAWLSAIVLDLLERQRGVAPRTSEVGMLRGRMKRAARPTLLLTPAKTPGFSKLGGEPQLPDFLPWPTTRGRPCAFLVQIELSALQSHAPPDWLPDAGFLFAFVDLEAHGFADQVTVLFHRDSSGQPRPPPARGLRYPERPAAFEPYMSMPSLDWMGVDLSEIDVTEDELDELSALPDEPFGDEIQHRIGGYPSELQGGQMAVECELIRRGLPAGGETEVTPAILRASKSWRMLFQIDSDPALKMNWGDGGRLYVFVREQDAKAGDFSRTITLSQTH